MVARLSTFVRRFMKLSRYETTGRILVPVNAVGGEKGVHPRDPQGRRSHLNYTW